MFYSNIVDLARKFGVETVWDTSIYTELQRWYKAYDTDGMNFAKVMSGEAARLATLEMEFVAEREGNIGDTLIKGVLDYHSTLFREKLELGCALGSLVIKPSINGDIEILPPTHFLPIACDSSGYVNKIIFIDNYMDKGKLYTRLEYHHFETNPSGVLEYIVENKAFCSNLTIMTGTTKPYDLGKEIPLGKVDRWREIEPIVVFEGVDTPLYGYFRMPSGNRLSLINSFGESIYANALVELGVLREHYEFYRKDIQKSHRVVFAPDTDGKVLPSQDGGRPIPRRFVNPLPDLIITTPFMSSASRSIESFEPNIRIAELKEILKTDLSLIASLCGFSTSRFIFDEGRNAITATQIEAEEQSTIQLCTEIQKALKVSLNDAIKALGYLLDLSTENGILTEARVSVYLNDLAVNKSEDRQQALQLVKDGILPHSSYLMEYEGYNESEARNADLKTSAKELFDMGIITKQKYLELRYDMSSEDAARLVGSDDSGVADL